MLFVLLLLLKVSFLAFFIFELGNEIISSLFSIVKKLLDARTWETHLVENKNIDGQTPLLIAAASNNLEIVKSLLITGAVIITAFLFSDCIFSITLFMAETIFCIKLASRIKPFAPVCFAFPHL